MTEAAAFLTLAREDLEAARKLLPEHARQAAFHLQQAAEKLVKAVLLTEGVPFPRTHQIGSLAVLLPEDHPWRPDLAAQDSLTAYATALRYPTIDGRVPPAPDPAGLASWSLELAALLDEIEVWTRADRSGA